MNHASSIEASDLDRHWDMKHPGATETKFRELLLAARENDGTNPSSRIELLTQIARAQGLQDKLPQAENTLKEAESLLEQAGGQTGIGAKIRCLMEKGRLQCLAKTPSQARPLFIEVWNLATASGEDFHAIDAAQMMSFIEPPKMQQEWTLKALALAERSSQPRAKQWLDTLYSTLGWHYFGMRQYEKSLEYFNKALGCLEVDLTASTLDANVIKKMTAAKCAIGRTLRAQNRFDDALKIQEELLGELNRANIKDGEVYEEMAECLTLVKRTSDAEMYFALAYYELSKDEWFMDNRSERIKRLKTMGKCK